MEHTALIVQIESARELLYTIEMKYGNLLHPEVIQQSVVLDGLINQFNQAKQKASLRSCQ
ncbi:hypothetical protein ASD24_18405 [Paenibacillus sp. Root52]|uniref:aspartyl-phosphate phosphatase Spo0E family protein n=1 Tax=Paenibacillus sp. Root52 TaxID=1736552 RepID=UPI000700D95A|nr:aspartyl-phosphate phosphatase Spo0E family protein [Paenibacillus sp. Root52]KQY79915.1 hypothetical protein ASD24_18405 [Paenibacillus sp. Root52]